jgi:ABC-type multidrug transport system fused ATPase/permease subunit
LGFEAACNCLDSRQYAPVKVLALVWRLLDHTQRRKLIALQLLSVLMALSAVGGIAAIVPFFAVLADPNSIQSNVLLHALYQHLGFASAGSFVSASGAAFIVLILFANAANLFGTLAINRFALRISDQFFIRLFEQYLRHDFGFHLRSNSAALASTLLHESGRVSIGVLRQGLVLVTNVVTIVFIMVSILILNPLIALGATLGLSVVYAAVYAITRSLLLQNGRSQSRYQAKRTQLVSESLGAIREVIILDAREFFVQRFTDYCRSFSRIELTTLAISSSPRNILECALVFCLVGVGSYLRSRSDSVGPWLEQLGFFGLAAYRLMPALQQTFVAVVSIRTHHVAFENLAAELEKIPRDDNVTHAQSAPEWRGRPRREIRVQDVSFRYAANRPAAISSVSLCLPAGSAVGFVGANGSGKTTLVDVLAGLLIPTSGHVEIDGVTLDRASRGAWQSTIAYVPQNVFVLDATLAENIALGVLPEQIDRERLDLVIELARLTEVLASLPDGYSELLGDRGCRLSGGQRQRLGIARALYRDASVLILDEATSALDNTAEEEIVGMLNALRPSRTLLLIAHRFSALRHCDTIHEFRHGRIVRSGTYADLQSAAHA